MLSSPRWRSRKTIVLSCIILLAVLIIVLLMTVRFNITGNWEGFYLLKGELGASFELKDDLLLGEGHRFIVGFDLDDIPVLSSLRSHAWAAREPYITYQWNERTGNGFVRNHLPGGRQLLTCFSRFKVDAGVETEGLFVGGGLPSHVRDESSVKANETGMAYYDGTRWYHIWCNVNEGIVDDRFNNRYPYAWKYLGSRVLQDTDKNLILESSHEMIIDGAPLSIKRRAYFRAGDTFFVLTVSVRNDGDHPITYDYFYGDEPWLGNYGTSGGNIGWSAAGLHQYVGVVDTRRSHYAGLFDYGNDAIHEGHDFTHTANFLEWFGDIEPIVYFSNGPFDPPPTGTTKVPLSGNQRFICFDWGPRTLRPNQMETYTLAIGMAGTKNGFPVMPDVDLKNYP